MNLRKPRTVKVEEKETLRGHVDGPIVMAGNMTVTNRPEARTGKQWRIEALTEAMNAVAHIDAARRLIKAVLRKTEES